MDYRNILALGFLLLCGGYFFRSLQPANATLPPYPVGTSYNGYPYESIQCNGCTQSTPFLTVPSDKYFILTTATIPRHGTCEIYIDNQSTYLDDTTTGNLFNEGRGRLVVSSNSSISTPISNCYIEGFYADPNNINLVSLHGIVSANSTSTLLTIPNDKHFVITGGKLNYSGTSSVYLLSDNTTILEGSLFYGIKHPFNNDKGNLKINAGTQLKIENNAGSDIFYYFQGYYAPL